MADDRYPTTRDELEGRAPVEENGNGDSARRLMPWWLALFLVVVSAHILLTEPCDVARALRWSGLFLVGSAALLALAPGLRDKAGLTSWIGLIGIVVWGAGVIALAASLVF